MMSAPDQLDDLLDRVDQICNGDISQDNLARVEELVRGDKDLCWAYICYSHVHAGLRWAPVELPSLAGEVDIALPIDRTFTTSQLTTGSALLSHLSATIHGTLGYLTSEGPVAYLIATVIVGVGILIAAFTYVNRPEEVADRLPEIAREHVTTASQREFVGQITGMVDCQWAESASPPAAGAVRLGQEYQLVSGLMEITYDTGAKVLLQGPVTYVIESKNSGFMSVGRLTGKVTMADAKGFAVRTPTATVTDLGTEFGVEVDERGVTTSHVFRGSVQIQVLAPDGKPQGAAQVLRENESVRVEGGQSERKIVVVSAPKTAAFVREIPKLSIKVLDLVDVVAGGDGYSGRRGRGINPTNGQVANEQPKYEDQLGADGDGKYHRVESLPFVDGVFIPDGRSGSVQTDSAGHTFDFSATSNRTGGYVWAGGPIPTSIDRSYVIPSKLGDVDYASPGHGLLFLHANKAITFDLEAIRLANPNGKLLRFRAVAGSTATESLADLWVLIDGKMRFRRSGINGSHGAYSIAIPLGENDRFLTLAATDGGNDIENDWTMFGDPRLELSTTRGATEIEEIAAPLNDAK